MKYDYVKLNPSEQIGPHSQAAVLPGFEPVVAGIIGMQDSLEFHGGVQGGARAAASADGK